MADDDGIISEIAGAVAGEFKKFGKSASSQITGSSNQTPQQSTNAAKTTDTSAHSVLDEFKLLGKSAAAQISGHTDDANLATLAKKDKEFSKAAEAQVKARIASLYEEYAAKKAREQQQQVLVEKQQEEVNAQQETEVKKQQTNSAIQKTRAEIKNYGAE